ncbi:MAG TPA: hypothetical protein VLT87_07480 [Thermoanaerobaculia bacterium]|nr:hypothetical protein [Thermoanaerobaculia bacterium]
MVYALGRGGYPLCDVEDCPRVFLYRSEDGGASWTAAARLDGVRPSALVVDPADPWVVYVGGVRLWKSLNGGACSCWRGGPETSPRPSPIALPASGRGRPHPSKGCSLPPLPGEGDGRGGLGR